MYLRIFTSIAVAFLFVLSQSEKQVHAQDKPNILLIFADDVGRDAIGCYGGQSFKTPNIDRLAKTGTRYTFAFSMPVCHPSRTTILTGRYPFQTGNPRWGRFPKTLEQQTFAFALKNLGYATAIVGKWQLGMLKNDPQQPHRMGFDEYCLFGWHEGPRYWQPRIWQNGKLRTDVEKRYGPDVYCDYLIDFMKRNKKKPFLAFYSMALCHDVTDDLKEPVAYGPKRKQYESFGEMVEKMDEIVGRLVAALEKNGLRKDTIIIFTTDNGSPGRMILRAENGRYIRVPVFLMWNGMRVQGGKGKLTDAGTRVPFIVNAPGRVPAGKTEDTLVDFSDFFRTFVSVAGGKAKKLAPGGYNFLAGVLKGQEGPKRPWAFAQHRGKKWVRTREWKLYDNGKLYKMREDHLEKQPVTVANRESRSAREELLGVFKKLGIKSK